MTCWTSLFPGHNPFTSALFPTGLCAQVMRRELAFTSPSVNFSIISQGSVISSPRPWPLPPIYIPITSCPASCDLWTPARYVTLLSTSKTCYCCSISPSTSPTASFNPPLAIKLCLVGLIQVTVLNLMTSPATLGVGTDNLCPDVLSILSRTGGHVHTVYKLILDCSFSTG